MNIIISKNIILKIILFFIIGYVVGFILLNYKIFLRDTPNNSRYIIEIAPTIDFQFITSNSFMDDVRIQESYLSSIIAKKLNKIRSKNIKRVEAKHSSKGIEVIVTYIEEEFTNNETFNKLKDNFNTIINDSFIFVIENYKNEISYQKSEMIKIQNQVVYENLNRNLEFEDSLYSNIEYEKMKLTKIENYYERIMKKFNNQNNIYEIKLKNKFSNVFKEQYYLPIIYGIIFIFVYFFIVSFIKNRKIKILVKN